MAVEQFPAAQTALEEYQSIEQQMDRMNALVKEVGNL